jgi:hypothetical protein
VLLCSLAALGSARAADVPLSADLPVSARAPASVAPPALYDPTRFELRAGAIGEVLGPETGTVGVNAELLFPRFFTVPVLPDIFTPRLHVGAVANTGDGTNFAYAGLTWTANYTERFFGELYFGAMVHDGNLDYRDPDRNALGCRVLFHVGTNFGYRFDRHWNVMLTLDHSSAGQALTQCPANQSLNQVGLRLGYQF